MSGIWRIVLVACLALNAPGAALSQGQEPPVFKQISHPFLPALTSEYFYFSGDGLIWFSTTRGLTSFDGSEIVYYSTPEQAEYFRLNNINVMTEDDRGNLYLGTESQVISYSRSSKTFSTLPIEYPVGISDLNIRVRSLYIDDKQSLYIGLSSIGMQIYNLGTKRIQSYYPETDRIEECNCDLLQKNTVSSFATHAVNRDELWVGTFNGIYLFNKNSKKFSRRFEVTNPMVNTYQTDTLYYNILKMDVVDDTTIWFSTSTTGFGRYNVMTGKAKLFLHNAKLHTKEIWKSYRVRSFAQWQPGKYILGISDPHPGLFDTRTEVNTLFSINSDKEKHDDIQHVTNDPQGNVWILNSGKLYAIVPGHFAYRSVSISNQSTPDYLANQLGKVYYDTSTRQYYVAVVFSSGIHVFDSLLNFKKIIPAPLFTNKWTYRETCTEWITKDGSNRYWTSGMETYIYSGRTTGFEYAEKLYPGLQWIKTKGECIDITTTKEGNILMRFLDGTLYHIRHKDFKTDTIRIPPRNSDKLIEIGTKQIVYDSLHNVVYLNNNNTLTQYNFVSGKSKVITAQAILGDNIETSRRVIDYTIDTDGRIWFLIPSYGIRIVDPLQFKCIDSIPLGTHGYLAGNYYYIRNGGEDIMCMVGVEGTLVYNYHEKKSWLLNHSNGTAATFDYFFGRCHDYFFANELDAIFYYRISDFSKIDFAKSSILNTLFANDSLVYTRSERNTGDTIRLKHFQNNISFSFSTQEFFYPERIEYAYQLSGIDRGWHYTHALNRKINYTRLSPGDYVLRLKAQFQGGDWEGGEKEYHIIIMPAFWQTDWFKMLTVAIACAAIFAIARWRIVTIGKKEQQRIIHEKDLLELEARALRAQMNPHFIFNSLNSIKSLINKNENEKAAEYLTTFSKLIRTLFLNSDSREVSLHEEIETCKLYAQIERMRFGDKVDFGFDIDQSIDLKDIRVPALIIQPFIENAIWHGLVPKERGGRLLVTVRKNNGAIECIIDDNGIGRELSLKYKAQYESSHQSKGISLTRTRLELDKFLNNREDGIEIIDKLDGYGKPAGTTVILTFKDNIV